MGKGTTASSGKNQYLLRERFLQLHVLSRTVRKKRIRGSVAVTASSREAETAAVAYSECTVVVRYRPRPKILEKRRANRSRKSLQRRRTLCHRRRLPRSPSIPADDDEMTSPDTASPDAPDTFGRDASSSSSMESGSSCSVTAASLKWTRAAACVDDLSPSTSLHANTVTSRCTVITRPPAVFRFKSHSLDWLKLSPIMLRSLAAGRRQCGTLLLVPIMPNRALGTGYCSRVATPMSRLLTLVFLYVAYRLIN